MNTVNVLFELGTEELPAHAVKSFPQQLQTMLASALANHSLTYQATEVYVTPRRIAVYIRALLKSQPDRTVEKTGPLAAVAFKENGELTPAGLGFARACQIEATELKKYLVEGRLLYRIMQPGAAVEQLLPAIFTSVIAQLAAGKTMRWGDRTYHFVRPVRWAVLLIDDQLLDAEFFGCKTQNYTYGHRFLAPEKIILQHADHYVAQLKEVGKVLVDQQVRRAKILEQLEALPKACQGQVDLDATLIDEVNGLVEWPVGLLGKFSADFLHIPAEALVSAMKKHQKSFPVVNNNQELLPYFVTISNITSRNPQQVILGNERVMHARLSDAAFFFNKDKQQPLAQRLTTLSTVTFQEKLGSLYDKTQRVVHLGEQLAETLQLDMHDCVRAAWLSLCDLTTTMVQEFPELQGIMGSYYALHDGEAMAVSRALTEQYLPRFSGDVLPTTSIGCVLAITHRLDTLAGQFAAGNKPTGDKDPFALRRQAQGLMRILVEKQISLDLPVWLTQALALIPIPSLNIQALTRELWKFCLDRLRVWHQEHGGNNAVFNAAAALQPTNPHDFNLRLQALENFRQLPAADALIAAHKRVKNILTKTTHVAGLSVDNGLLKEHAEQQLAALLNELHPVFQRLMQQRDYATLLTKLAELRPAIDLFFAEVMVMVEDNLLRNNRLVLLTQLRYHLECVADISLLSSY